jgi:hypothetical protein
LRATVPPGGGTLDFDLEGPLLTPPPGEETGKKEVAGDGRGTQGAAPNNSDGSKSVPSRPLAPSSPRTITVDRDEISYVTARSTAAGAVPRAGLRDDGGEPRRDCSQGPGASPSRGKFDLARNRRNSASRAWQATLTPGTRCNMWHLGSLPLGDLK